MRIIYAMFVNVVSDKYEYEHTMCMILHISAGMAYRKNIKSAQK